MQKMPSVNKARQFKGRLEYALGCVFGTYKCTGWTQSDREWAADLSFHPFGFSSAHKDGRGVYFHVLDKRTRKALRPKWLRGQPELLIHNEERDGPYLSHLRQSSE